MIKANHQNNFLGAERKEQLTLDFRIADAFQNACSTRTIQRPSCKNSGKCGFVRVCRSLSQRQ